jgi:nicotinate-nucleotide pyrophosphorylase (carboxylating)
MDAGMASGGSGEGGPALALDLVLPLVDAALAEDVGPGDVTTESTVPEDARAVGEITAKEDGVVCGLPVARAVFERLDPGVLFEADARDGDRVAAGAVIARVEGPARAILTGERTALNFLQHLSGIATGVARMVEALEGTGTRLLDTRKTVPGMRLLAKYAVRCGGGANHRTGLYDKVLIKENHLAAAGGVRAAVTRSRAAHPGLEIEVEVTNLRELDEALAAEPDWILLDNFRPTRVADAVARISGWSWKHKDRRPRVEVSGGITAETVRDYALEGVDFISMGALTHSARALDLSLDLVLERGLGGKASADPRVRPSADPQAKPAAKPRAGETR